jgi:hypothetical protein
MSIDTKCNKRWRFPGLTMLLEESWGINQRLWNSFNSDNGRIGGVFPYYGELLSTVVRQFGPETAFNRIVQIINEHEETEADWLKESLSTWTPRSAEAKAIGEIASSGCQARKPICFLTGSARR